VRVFSAVGGSSCPLSTMSLSATAPEGALVGMHGLEPLWFATPSPRQTYTDHSSPASRRTIIDSIEVGAKGVRKVPFRANPLCGACRHFAKAGANR
jgi:hypothetical protein